MKKMRKMLITAVAIVSMALLSGCNRQVVNSIYQYDRAIINLPNNQIVEGKIDSWRDYDGGQLQVTIDGITYRTSFFNAVLIKE